jgi:hypothetical protein
MHAGHDQAGHFAAVRKGVQYLVAWTASRLDPDRRADFVTAVARSRGGGGMTDLRVRGGPLVGGGSLL